MLNKELTMVLTPTKEEPYVFTLFPEVNPNSPGTKGFESMASVPYGSIQPTVFNTEGASGVKYLELNTFFYVDDIGFAINFRDTLGVPADGIFTIYVAVKSPNGSFSLTPLELSSTTGPSFMRFISIDPPLFHGEPFYRVYIGPSSTTPPDGYI